MPAPVRPVSAAHHTAALILGFVALLAAACAAVARSAAPSPAALEVVVGNHAWEDVTVYASTGPGSRRLGSVTAGRTGWFRMSALPTSATELELVARPLASDEVRRSERILVHAGQTVTWTLHHGRLGGELTIR